MLSNLHSFVDGLSDTKIEFLFFTAVNSKPMYRQDFKRYSEKHDVYYIAKGQDKNYFYAYRESIVKYIVSTLGKTKTHPVTIYDASVHGRGGSTNLGNHVDFSIFRQRSGNILCKTHMTYYSEDAVDSTKFNRDSFPCNFRFEIKNISDFATFNATKCENISGKPMATDIETTYSEVVDQRIVYRLAHISAFGTGIKLTPGGARHRQRRFKSIKNSAFEEYFAESFLKALGDKYDGIESIAVIYDTNRTNYKKHIVVLMEHIDYSMKAFFLDANQFFKALDAHTRINLGKQPGKKQMQAYHALAESVRNALL